MAVNQLDTFIPKVWSTRLNVQLRKNLVLAGLTNRNWQGDVRPGGTVQITRPGSISVSDYDPTSTTISYETPSATKKDLAIDTRKHFAFQVDDLDADLSNVNLVDAYTEEAAEELADQVDQSIADEYANQGAGNVDLDLTSSPDVYGALTEAGRLLDEKNVPRTGRFWATSPRGYEELLKDDKFTRATDAGDQAVLQGALGMAAGFSVLVSNNLVDAGSTDVKRKSLVGTRRAITHARALTGEPEALRLEGKFAVGIRGEMAWGNLTVDADALGTVTLTE